jgi:hypothetical protein
MLSSSAVVGAIIILIQLKAVAIETDIYFALALLALSIFFSLVGQDHIVDSLLKGQDIYQTSKMLKLIRWASLGSLGLGAGYFTGQLI